MDVGRISLNLYFSRVSPTIPMGTLLQEQKGPRHVVRQRRPGYGRRIVKAHVKNILTWREKREKRCCYKSNSRTLRSFARGHFMIKVPVPKGVSPVQPEKNRQLVKSRSYGFRKSVDKEKQAYREYLHHLPKSRIKVRPLKSCSFHATGHSGGSRRPEPLNCTWIFTGYAHGAELAAFHHGRPLEKSPAKADKLEKVRAESAGGGIFGIKGSAEQLAQVLDVEKGHFVKGDLFSGKVTRGIKEHQKHRRGGKVQKWRNWAQNKSLVRGWYLRRSMYSFKSSSWRKRLSGWLARLARHQKEATS